MKSPCQGIQGSCFSDDICNYLLIIKKIVNKSTVKTAYDEKNEKEITVLSGVETTNDTLVVSAKHIPNSSI